MGALKIAPEFKDCANGHTDGCVQDHPICAQTRGKPTHQNRWNIQTKSKPDKYPGPD